MALNEKKLDELARINMGLGPVRTTQGGAAYTSNTNDAPNEGDGVDCAGAAWAEIIVRPVGGDVTFDILGRGGDSTFDVIDQGGGLTSVQDRNYRQMVNVKDVVDELYVRLTGGSATGALVIISPCNG